MFLVNGLPLRRVKEDQVEDPPGGIATRSSSVNHL